MPGVPRQPQRVARRTSCSYSRCLMALRPRSLTATVVLNATLGATPGPRCRSASRLTPHEPTRLVGGVRAAGSLVGGQGAEPVVRDELIAANIA